MDHCRHARLADAGVRAPAAAAAAPPAGFLALAPPAAAARLKAGPARADAAVAGAALAEPDLDTDAETGRRADAEVAADLG